MGEYNEHSEVISGRDATLGDSREDGLRVSHVDAEQPGSNIAQNPVQPDSNQSDRDRRRPRPKLRGAGSSPNAGRLYGCVKIEPGQAGRGITPVTMATVWYCPRGPHPVFLESIIDWEEDEKGVMMPVCSIHGLICSSRE